MNKVTEKIKKEIFKLNKEGLKLRAIAKELGLSHSTIDYHLYPETRKERIKKQTEYFRNLPEKERKRVNRNRREYIKNWLINKYHTDEKFRIKKLEYSKLRYIKLKKIKDGNKRKGLSENE